MFGDHRIGRTNWPLCAEGSHFAARRKGGSAKTRRLGGRGGKEAHENIRIRKTREIANQNFPKSRARRTTYSSHCVCFLIDECLELSDAPIINAIAMGVLLACRVPIFRASGQFVGPLKGVSKGLNQSCTVLQIPAKLVFSTFMSTHSALEEISNLTNRIESLKQQAVSEIASKIAEKKAEILALESDYEKITGKTVRGELKGQGTGTRVRLTKEQKKALPDLISKALGSGEMSLGQLIDTLGQGIPKSAIKAVLNTSKLFKMTGERSGAKYSLR